MGDLLTKEDECTFLSYKEPLVQFLLDETNKFNGGNLIDQKDLQALVGDNPNDQDNCICNFVIDAYFDRIRKDSASRGIKAKAIECKKFDNSVAKTLASTLSFSILEQDAVIVPCNAAQHWTLLVVLPPSNEMFVLDNMATTNVKPTSLKVVHKIQQDIAQQSNNYDCGVYVCAYARSLLLQSPMPSDCRRFRLHILFELHRGTAQPFDVNSSPVVGEYYAMEYERKKQVTFYIGRAVGNSSTAPEPRLPQLKKVIQSGSSGSGHKFAILNYYYHYHKKGQREWLGIAPVRNFHREDEEGELSSEEDEPVYVELYMDKPLTSKEWLRNTTRKKHFQERLDKIIHRETW
ncbi:predicted protein [Nematostella vectensis]|uniref:Ubiquitin-like protease family profile domain-containing protein n=1 Tax=Nematostella vectensis TaxID=45351 RepID=A7RZ58_NEMVE|nr:predicted protein [Nematostella vectensis]|eukprot:XP_001635289.1 predicted protein [Nematostella vectensis]